MRHLVTAVAHADAHMFGGIDNLTCFFIVQNMHAVFFAEGTFINKNTPKLGFTPHKKRFYEIFLDCYVLIKKIA